MASLTQNFIFCTFLIPTTVFSYCPDEVVQLSQLSLSGTQKKAWESVYSARVTVDGAQYDFNSGTYLFQAIPPGEESDHASIDYMNSSICEQGPYEFVIIQNSETGCVLQQTNTVTKGIYTNTVLFKQHRYFNIVKTASNSAEAGS